MITHEATFATAIDALRREILLAPEVDTGHWQGVPTEGRPDLATKELTNVAFTCPMRANWRVNLNLEGLLQALRKVIQPNLPWADDHFAERVSRSPTNPGKAYKSWPWWRGQNDKTMVDGKFTHTYQERYWPKWAGYEEGTHKSGVRGAPGYKDGILGGIRYQYGDLDDVVNQLLQWPYGRQAYLPIFFPEDTGNVGGGRIPCTLGYHFLLRDTRLHMWYFIRSCDFIRHFRDDLYLSARLLLWVLEELRRKFASKITLHENNIWADVTPGDFTFVCPSLHYHRGDEHHLKS
jgi:hypothetical protein